MFWLRTAFFASPLLVVAWGSWLFDRVGDLQLARESDALVCGIRDPVGYLNPLAAADGVTAEIADLIFEPLLRRDADLNLVPNLLRSWGGRTFVTIRCESEEAAGETEALLRSGEALADGLEMLSLERSGAVLNVSLSGMSPDLDARLLSGIPAGNLDDSLFVRVKTRHSSRESIEAFLAATVERSQIRMMEFVDDGEVHLFLRGETDRFLKDLELYFQSNPSLGATVGAEGTRSHSTVREMLLELRPDVTWHDGTPFTSRDVLFSYRELTGPGSPLPLAGGFYFVESLEAAGLYGLRAVCRESPATAMESWEKLPVLPAHLFPSSGGIHDGEALRKFSLEPVGTGPYRLDRRRDDGGIELVAFRPHFRGEPVEERLRYRRFDSLEAKLLALRYGYLDLMIPDERFVAWSVRHSGQVERIRDIATIQHVVVWNLDRDPFREKAVRSALALSIDTASILRETAVEYQVPSTSLFFPGHPSVGAPMPVPVHDPVVAGRLLEESGFRLDEESGKRVGRDGKALGFTLLVNRGAPEHRRFAAALAEQWAAVGIEARIEAVEWAELLAAPLPGRDYDAVLLSWKIPCGLDRFEVWHSSSAEPGGGNPSGLRDETVDRLLGELRRETDPAKLREITAKLNETIAGLHPCLFLGDSGRFLTFRSGALRIVRPDTGTVPKVEPFAIGKAGFSGIRPWVVRRESVELEAGAGTKASSGD